MAIVVLLLLGEWVVIKLAINRVQLTLQGISGQVSNELDTKLGSIEQILSDRSDQLSKDQEVKLESLEQILSDRRSIPSGVEQAKDLSDKLNALFKSMRPKVQVEASPRLLPVRWGVEAVWTLRQAEKNLGEFEDALTSLLDREPEGCPKFLHQLVEGKRRDAEKASIEKNRKEAIERARNAKDDQAVAAAREGLSGFKDPDVDKLRKELSARLLRSSMELRIDVLKRTLERSGKLETGRLRQAGIARVQDAAVSVLLDWEIEDPRPEEQLKKVRALIVECQESLDGIAHQQQEELAKRLRDYQKFALENIEGFRPYQYEYILPNIERDLRSFGSSSSDVDWPLLKACPSIKEVIQSKLGIDMADVEGASLPLQKQKDIYRALGWPAWKNGVNTELAYRCTREAMIRFLLPINLSYLDPQVAQLYQKEFSKGWEKLEGRVDQLEVANATVSVPKKPLD